jgi:hypothetical protein
MCKVQVSFRQNRTDRPTGTLDFTGVVPMAGRFFVIMYHSLVRPKSSFITILLVGPQMRELTHQENGVIFNRIQFGLTAQECKKTCILAWIS